MKRAVYLSARFPRQHELRVYRDELVSLGHRVTSRWLDASAEDAVTSWPHWAGVNAEDIEGCDTFIAFTEDWAEIKHAMADAIRSLGADRAAAVAATSHLITAARGGRQAELGYALALQATDGDVDGQPRELILVGPREHVLHSADALIQFDAWTEALEWIGASR